MKTQLKLAMTTALLAGATFAKELGDLTYHFRSEVQTAYMTRGKICNDEPIESNTIELEMALSDYASVGFWNWHYHDLTPNRRDCREQIFPEFDWAVYGSCLIPLAEKWSLSFRTSPRFIHQWFYDDRNAGRDFWWEWFGIATLNNPYLTPYLVNRCGFFPDKYVYFEPGVMKSLDLGHGFKLTSQTGLAFGDQNQLTLSYRNPQHGSRYHSPLMAVSFSLLLDYQLSENVKLFVSVSQLDLLNSQLRDQNFNEKHNDWTWFGAGIDFKF